MKLRQIEIFIAICKNRSIAKASHELYISQQAASKSIKELEIELNCDLLIRQSFGVTPTESGEYVYGEFQKIMKIIKGIPSYLDILKCATQERINVGMAYGVIDSIGISIINHFTELYPNIHLDVYDDPDYIVEEKLSSGKLDVAFVIEPVDRQSFDVYPLKKEFMCICINKGHPLFNQKKISLESLRGQKFLNINPLFKGRGNLFDYCMIGGFEPEFVYNSNFVFASTEFCLGNKMSIDDQALNIVPMHKIQNDQLNTRYVPLQDPPMEWKICLATRKNQNETYGIRAFREYLLSLTL